MIIFGCVFDVVADETEDVVSRWIRCIFGKDDNGFENDGDDLDDREIDDDDFDSVDDILSLMYLKKKQSQSHPDTWICTLI